MIQPKTESVCLPARYASLPQLLAMLPANPVEANQLPTYLRAQLAVEELFVNSIQHGYREESDQPVWLTVERIDAVLRVVYADQSDAYDTLALSFIAPDVVEANHDERPVGGLGKLLVANLARHCQYTREADRNVTLLEFALAAASDLTPPVPVHPKPR